MLWGGEASEKDQLNTIWENPVDQGLRRPTLPVTGRGAAWDSEKRDVAGPRGFATSHWGLNLATSAKFGAKAIDKKI